MLQQSSHYLFKQVSKNQPIISSNRFLVTIVLIKADKHLKKMESLINEPYDRRRVECVRHRSRKQRVARTCSNMLLNDDTSSSSSPGIGLLFSTHVSWLTRPEQNSSSKLLTSCDEASSMFFFSFFMRSVNLSIAMYGVHMIHCTQGNVQQKITVKYFVSTHPPLSTNFLEK